MGRTRLALAAGLSAIAVTLGVVLSRAPETVAGTNGVPANFAIAFIHGGEVICQAGGTVPAGTSAVRVSLSVNVGPSVDVKVYSGSTLVTEGGHGAGWGVDETVTVPVRRVTRALAGTRICTTIGPAVEPIQVNGIRVPSASSASGVWLRMEYLRPASGSWLARVPAIADDMGIAHAPTGAWAAYLVIALMLGVCALASRLALRELR
jgi:hypothetical protein